MRWQWCAFALLTVGGCRCGTLSQEELEASYEIMPDVRPSLTLQELLADIDPPYRLLELTVHPKLAQAEVVRSSQPDRVIDYHYDGWSADETGFEPLGADLDAATAGFTVDEIPLARIDELVAQARAAIDRPIASFSRLHITREPGEPLEIQISFRSFREGTAFVVFDGTGRPVRVHQ